MFLHSQQEAILKGTSTGMSSASTDQACVVAVNGPYVHPPEEHTTSIYEDGIMVELYVQFRAKHGVCTSSNR